MHVLCYDVYICVDLYLQRYQFVQESLDLLFMMYWEKQAYKGERFDPINTVSYWIYTHAQMNTLFFFSLPY